MEGLDVKHTGLVILDEFKGDNQHSAEIAAEK